MQLACTLWLLQVLSVVVFCVCCVDRFSSGVRWTFLDVPSVNTWCRIECLDRMTEFEGHVQSACLPALLAFPPS